MLVVRHYPDPILGHKTQPVKRIDSGLRKLVTEMFETMYQEHGVGLAAPQVGESVRMCVINPTGESDGELVLINPVIEESAGQTTEEEGCLSVPGIRSKVTRFATVKVRAYDQDGQEIDLEADGLEARVLQHELDHLDGRLFVDLLNDAARMAVGRRLKTLEERYERDKEKEV